jgi:putative ABC transport system substrate-binding protein
MLKKISIFIIVSIFSIPVFSQNILVVSSHRVPFFADVANAVKDYIQVHVPSAIVDVRYSDEGDIIASAEEKKYDVICVFGASDAKKIITRFKDIPIVFSLIMDPVMSGLVDSLGPTGKNITGISLSFPVDKQLKIVRKILPKSRKIGLIYAGASQNVYTSLQEQNVDIKGVKVSGATEVPSVMESLGGVDAMWLVMDTHVYDKDSLEFALKYCVDRKIPVIGFAANTVKAGAILGFVYDYIDLGRQTGEAIEMIISGKNPGDISIASPRKVGYALNKRIARYLNIDLSPDTINSASEVFE